MPHKSVVFSISLIAFLTGVFTRSFFIWPEWAMFVLIVIGIIIFIFGQKRLFKLLGLGMILATVGSLFFDIRQPVVSATQIQYYNGHWLTFTGIIASEPDRRSDQQKLTVKANQLRIDEKDKKVSGKVLIQADLYPEYQYGDMLEISCRIITPEPIEDFAYDRYLALSGIYSVCYQPKITKIAENNGNPVLSQIYKTKGSLIKTINRMMGEPQAAFLAGLLVGARRGIPDSLMADFNRTGVTHIIAISGYNITIIASIVLSLTQRYIGRKKAFWLVIVALGVFAIITGAQASVVRATIMGVVVLLARQVGRVSQVGNVLILAAWIMVLVNPLVLAFDAGFQLSFLATIGLVYLSPKIEKYFKWVPERLSLRESLVCTLSATIMTLPLIVFQFERLSLVAPIANILILPIIPFIMAVGFIASILGMIWLGLGQIISWLAWLMLSYVILIVRNFSALDFASIEIKHLPTVFLFIGYLFIFIVIKNPLSFIRRQRNNRTGVNPL